MHTGRDFHVNLKRFEVFHQIIRWIFCFVAVLDSLVGWTFDEIENHALQKQCRGRMLSGNDDE